MPVIMPCEANVYRLSEKDGHPAQLMNTIEYYMMGLLAHRWHDLLILLFKDNECQNILTSTTKKVMCLIYNAIMRYTMTCIYKRQPIL